MQSIDHRSQAVRRAGSVGNNGHILGEHVLVNTVDNRGVHTLAGSGNQHLLGAAFQVSQAFFFGTESTRAFEHNVHTQFFPGKVAGITIAENAHAIAVDDEILFSIGNFFDFHISVEVAVNRVMAQQMSIRLDVTHGVNGHDFDVMLFAQFVVSAQDVATDAAKARNGNFNGHLMIPL